MPQVVAAVLIGAGIAASLKWLAKELTRAGHDTRLAAEKMKRRATSATAAVPKDLGSLEWDAEAGVYRPSAPRSH